MTEHLCDSEFPWCLPDARTGEFYKLRVKDLSRTQFAVGKAEVDVRAGRLRKKFNKNPASLHDYLRVRPVPIVIRGKSFYLVDHHHLTRALYDAVHKQRGKDICAYVKVMANASTQEETCFWKTMHERNWVYLFDGSGGGSQQPATLPEHIKDLKFDPYRSLAWIVREHHGYVKKQRTVFGVQVGEFFPYAYSAGQRHTCG